MTATAAAERTEPLLRVRGLRVEFSTRDGVVHAVNGVDFDVMPGQAIGIVGESGSGKTVTVMAVARLLDAGGRVVDGAIEFEGVDLLRADKAFLRDYHGHRLGIVFQNPMTSLDPVFPVGDQITESFRFHALGRRWFGRRVFLREIVRTLNADLKKAHWQRIAGRMLRAVGVPAPEHAAGSYPSQLSGGMRQRAMIASAIALEPRLVIADEPTTALDVTIQAQILDVIDRLKENFGTALILVTHDLSIVSQHCDVVYVMYAGKVLERAPTDDLFANPRHPYTRGLLEAIPRIDGERQELRGIPGSPPDLIDVPPGCPFAPRCERVLAVCRESFPVESSVGKSHGVWCYNPW